MENNHKPFKIPSLEEFKATAAKIAETSPKEIVTTLNDDPFIEVRITDSAVKDTDNTPSENITPVVDTRRTMFFDMWKIALGNSASSKSTETFYKQAVFMENFEDDYPNKLPLSIYYPTYQQLGYRQLRTYFTWRTKLRNGTIEETSLSYAFLYIYELLNNIGVQNPVDGFEKLMLFWQEYRKFNNEIDSYIIRWIKDYFIFYPMDVPFHVFAFENNLLSYYPEVFVFSSNKETSFELYNNISKYNIKESVFYNDENKTLINDCFYYILEKLRAAFKEKNNNFDNLIFFSRKKESVWLPFHGAVFHPAYKQPDRTVVITDKEVYSCINNKWFYNSVILTENGKTLISYILKEMESVLRKNLKFKYKIKANPNSCDEATLNKLKKHGIEFPDFIEQAVLEYQKILTRKEVKINTESLKTIRIESLRTQEKLIVPEEPIKVKEPITVPAEIVKPNTGNIWASFKLTLTDTEIQAIKIILSNGSIKPFITEKNIMLEVLVDSINEKSMDCVGDTTLELTDTVTIYDEYKNKLMDVIC
ncbi:TerB N-terminal domain-containing protein [Eubacteriales bacterium OttesenSCG-928-G02]|nr:TerB N-terminal domain-containing protein [Eubacteriales bacterium OttesenSCG-928-G02]